MRVVPAGSDTMTPTASSRSSAALRLHRSAEPPVPMHVRPRCRNRQPHCREARSALTSTPPLTGCASSAMLARTCATTPTRGGVTATDTSLTYPPAAPIAMGVTAAAYTNNDLDPSTGTTLFDIDSMLDQVAIQAPANAGTLSLTGKLGVDAAADAGFDIYSTVRRGVTVDVEGFAVLNVGGSPRLFEVALLTGRATDQGKFRSAVTDIAIELNQR